MHRPVSMRIHSRYAYRMAHHLAAIGHRSQLQYRMKRDFDIRKCQAIQPNKVCINGTQNGLVSDQQHIGLSLKLHDNGREPQYKVRIRLSSFRIAIMKFITISGHQIRRIQPFNLTIGKPIAFPCIDLIQRLPCKLRKLEKLRRLNGTLERACPNLA